MSKAQLGNKGSFMLPPSSMATQELVTQEVRHGSKGSLLPWEVLSCGKSIGNQHSSFKRPNYTYTCDAFSFLSGKAIDRAWYPILEAEIQPVC